MIHKTAVVSRKAKIGKNTSIWAFTRVREGAEIGDDCVIGDNVYIDSNVKIGTKVKIQNKALIYHGVTIEDSVFIGPMVCLSNDNYPRATNSFGQLKTSKDWQVGKILVKKGASLCAGVIVTPGITIGSYSLIGAGSVVTRSVPDYALVFGHPAKIQGYVCKQGHQLKKGFCSICQLTIKIINEKK